MNEAATPHVSTTLHPSQSKQLIDEYLLPVLNARVTEARTMEPSYAALWQSIATLFEAGGKRFRSYMTLLTFQALSDKPIEDIIPAAAAQELLHLGVLIHDDIIDRDYVRYGVDNITADYLKQYDALIEHKEERIHYAQSAAILAGDLLLSEAYLQTLHAKADTELLIATQKILSQAIYSVVGGELLDTEAAFKKVASAPPLVIAEHKTSSYSFVAPFLLGATLAGSDNSQKNLLQQLGQKLGIGYQIRDDIMGVFGDESVTGKSSEGDIREGKRTLLIDEFYRQANPEQRLRFDTLFGAPTISSEEVEEVRHLLIDSGARAAIESTISDYQSESEAIVESLAIADEHKAAFRKLISICLQRER